MLTNRTLTLAADTIVNDVKIATFGAVLNIEAGRINFVERHINEEACEEYRDIVRADRAAFEDFAYDVKTDIKGMLACETMTAGDAE